MDPLVEVRRLMARKAGLRIDGIRDQQLGRRLTAFARREGLDVGKELVQRLLIDEAMRSRLTDALTINVTGVFRNRVAWETLWNTHLANVDRSIRVWSAGCSAGAEAITMAIMAREAGVTAKILATDIDGASLERARSSVFTDAEMREVPARIRSSFFTETPEGWAADPTLRTRIDVRRHDLIADPLPRQRFDVIACRNVVIYFSDDAKRALHERFVSALRPGGLLFIGGSETIASPHRLGLDPLGPMFYRRTDPAAEDLTVRRAG